MIEYKDDKQLEGVQTLENGDVYQGAFKDGKKHGKGILRTRNDRSYEGEWKYDKPHGFGINTFPNGKIYTVDILPHDTKMYWNCIDDHDGMKSRKGGTIVNMSSIAGRKVYPDHTVYCGTKYFVHAISESIRSYLAPYDVRVVVISPGIIETEVLSGVLDKNTLKNYQDNNKDFFEKH